MRRGCDLINRYGNELEYDLHAYLGLNLSDWFIGRDAHAWGKLNRLAMQLPAHGRFKAAILDDDEYARSVGLPEVSDDESKRGPTYVDYDPQIARLTDIADLLISLRSTLIAVNSEKKVKEPKYMTRPESAFDRLKRRHAREKRELLRSILTPDE